MKHKIKILVVTILCAFMVGCAQSEQPVQQDAQTSQTQQSEVKEDTQTAEQTQKETPEEVLQRCTLKGEWSPELTKLMETINAEHQAIQKPEVEYGDFFQPRVSESVDISADVSPDGGLTIQQMEIDTDYLFAELKERYGLYFYFGGDEVFDKTKEKIKEDCRTAENLTPETYQQILLDNFSFIKDFHFNIEKNNTIDRQVPFFYTETAFFKTAQGYQTLDGRVVVSVEGYDDLDQLFKRCLSREGEIVYYPVVFGAIKLRQDEEDEFIPNDLVVHYEKGKIESLKAEPYQRVEKDETIFNLYENQDVPIALLNRFGFDEGGDKDAQNFLSSADLLKKQPVSMIDLRKNGGGNGALPYKWFYSYAGQKVPSNFYSLSISEKQSSPAGSYYISDETMNEMCDLQSVEGGTISDTAEDQFVEQDQLLILLTSKNSASSTECFVDMAHNLENTLIIGENTCGCLLGDSWGIDVKLPYSCLSVGFGHSIHVFPEGYFEEGYGFEPDLWCPAVYAEEAAVNFVHRMMK